MKVVLKIFFNFLKYIILMDGLNIYLEKIVNQWIWFLSNGSRGIRFINYIL